MTPRADTTETLYHVTVLSNLVLAYDKYSQRYEKSRLPRTTYPDRFFLLRPSELEIGVHIIRRYIHRKLPRIRHCYEKELTVTPTLAGNVTTRFQISPRGTVEGAAVTGLKNAIVEKCVAVVIKSIEFRSPKSGGYVNVKYPFIFEPAR